MKIIKFTVEEAQTCFCGLSHMFSNYESRKEYQNLLMDFKIEFSHSDLSFMSDIIVSYSKDDDMLLNIEVMKNLKKINQYEEIFSYSSNRQGEICFKALIDKIKSNINHAADIPLWQFNDNKQAFLSYTNGNLRALINNDNKLVKYAWWNGSAWELISEEKAFVIYGDFYKQCCIELQSITNNADPKAIQEINKKITRWNSSKNSKEAMDNLKRDRRYVIDMSEYDRPNNIICSNDGKIINLITGEIKNATRSDMVLFTSKYNLVDKEKSIKFIDEKLSLYNHILGKERLEFLFDFVAYKLSGRSLQKAIFLIGTGGTGKSLFKNIINDLFEDRVTNIPYDYFIGTNNRGFEKAKDDVMTSLNGKLIGLSSEGNEYGQNINDSKFKSILSGSSEGGRGAFKEYNGKIKLHQFDLVFDTNNQPIFYKIDDAISRRLLFVNFINKVPKDKINPNFYVDELEPNFDYIFSYFVYRAINLNSRLIDKKVLEIPDIIKNDTKSNTDEIDSIGKFIEYKLQPFDDYVKAGEVIKYYINYCKDENMTNIFDGQNINFLSKSACDKFVKALKGYEGFEGVEVSSKRNRADDKYGRYRIYGIAFIDESEDNPFMDPAEKLPANKEVIEKEPITWQQMYI